MNFNYSIRVWWLGKAKLWWLGKAKVYWLGKTKVWCLAKTVKTKVCWPGKPAASAATRGERATATWVLAAALCLLTGASAPRCLAEVASASLNDGWRFHAAGSAPVNHAEAGDWRPATVPGVVQTDLRHAGAVADPFFGDDEKRLQWIGQTDWEYEKTFEATPQMLRYKHLELVFEGLDTFADVTLNGKPILHADNMFRSWRVDARPLLQPGQNKLQILFHSPYNVATSMVAALPYVIPGSGYEPLDREKGLFPIGQYIRKAGYQFGWDWGPKFVTEGIWRPVRLEMWEDARITAFHVAQESVTAERAVLLANVTADSDAAGDAMLQVEVNAPDGRELRKQAMPVRLDRGANHFVLPMRIDKPERWFPNGYGPQSRYSFEARLVRGAKVLASRQVTTGLRSVELRRTKDQWGTSFEFVINGLPVYVKGANFIPLDSFPPETSTAKKREILTAARDVHMNMLRVWGGGFYETDEFYDLCDELGLMVWHDFMFGGGMVPGDKAFQDNVRAEAEEQVQRLSDHPSLTIWCGNNEVETAWKSWDGQRKFKSSVTADVTERVWQDYVVMFRDILKGTVAKYGNGVPYWPSSPGNNFEESSGESGDAHSWKVWSAGAPATEYQSESPRFLSEFGFQAMPDLRTVRSYAGTDEDLQSPELLNHERFVHGYARMQQYLTEEFLPPRDFASLVYLSQVMQAEAIQVGVEHMRSLRPENMGTMFWQLDDCWPVASWASIDYYGRWKALHYYARRFYAPLLVAPEAKDGVLSVRVVSDEQSDRTAVLRLRVMRFDGSVLADERQAVHVAALASTAAAPYQVASWQDFDAKAAFAVLTLEQAGTGQAGTEPAGPELARTIVYFAKAREMKLPLTQVQRVLKPEKDGYSLELQSPVLARDVAIAFGNLDAKLDDNYFDLLPNERRVVHVRSAAPLETLRRSLVVRSLVDAADL